MILPERLERHGRERPDAVALAVGRELPSLGYGALADAVARGADRLAGLGVLPGDRVAIVAGNRVETAIAVLSVLAARGIAVPVDPAYPAPEIELVLTDAAPRLALAEADAREAVEEAARRGAGAPAVRGLEGFAAGAEDRAAAGSCGRRPGPTAHDPALLVYTSGTTGRRKGALLTHRNLAATVGALGSAWEWRPDDRLLLALPLFHVHGLIVGLLTALATGARVELRPRFRADEVARELAFGRATLFFGVPTMYVRLVEAIDCLADSTAIGSMRLFASGSAPLAPETFEAFRRRTGHAILERYGMSETGMLLSNPYRGERRPGTVGVPLPGVEARIVDREGRPVRDGETGELAVRGPNVFCGYWRAQAKTAESFLPDAGGRRWFRTGDLALRDPADGYVTLLGRTRELILRGGANVYPREVEEALEAAPGVREAAVVGRPDAELGEVPVAYVVAEPAEDGAEAPDPEPILAHCRQRLARYKVPVELRFLAELPRNALGKVQKHRLE